MKSVFVLAWLPLVLGCPLQTSTSSTLPSGSTSSSGGDDRASGASSGTSVTVPDLTGKTKAEAEAAVSAAGITGGLRVDNDAGTYDSTTKVCSQVPGGGNQTSSTLFGSIRMCFVERAAADSGPQLVGASVAEATKRAKAAGFTGTVEVLTLSEFDASCKADTVCRVTPDHWELNQSHTMTLYTNRKMAISAPE